MLWTDDKDDKDDDVERDLVALVPRRRAKGIVGSVLQPGKKYFKLVILTIKLTLIQHIPQKLNLF